MNEVKIIVRNERYLSSVLVDGNFVTFKRDKKELGYSCIYKTEAESINIILKTSNVLLAKNWILFEILFFIFTIFGIFDVRNKYNDLVDFHCVVNLNKEGENLIILASPIMDSNNNSAFVINTKLEYEEITNTKIISDEIINRKNKIKKIKLLTSLGMIIVVVLAFVLSIVLS